MANNKAISHDLITFINRLKKGQKKLGPPYSLAMKERIAEAVEEGVSIHEIRKITGLSWGTIDSWYKKSNFKELDVERQAPQEEAESENTITFRYPNGLEVRIVDKNLTPELVELLKGA